MDKSELNLIPFVESLSPSGCSQDTLSCLTWTGHVMCLACRPMEDTTIKEYRPYPSACAGSAPCFAR